MTETTKSKLLLYIFAAAIVAVLFIPVPTWAKLLLGLALAALFLYLRRAYIHFAIGARKLEKGDPTCWDSFKKALDAHLPPSHAVQMATAFIKQGDTEFGNQICRGVIAKRPGTEEANLATVTLSMGLWVQGRLDEAIALLRDLKATGYGSRTLDINLTTYLLQSGEVDEALQIIKATESEGLLSHGMLDNKLWALILKGRFDDCQELVTELMEERKPRFPEAYVHSAQVMLRQGRIEKAVEYLDRAAAQKFSLNGAMGQEYLESLRDGLEDPETRLAWAWALDNDPVSMAMGRAVKFDPEKGAGYKEVRESQVRKAIRPSKAPIDDLDDDREPNTDLTDEDLALTGYDD